MKIKTCIFLVLVLLSAFVFTSYGENIKVISLESGVVTDVIDGDAIAVRLGSSGRVAFVRLVGIDALGNDDAISFLTSYLMGKKVLIQPELSVTSNIFDTRWNFAYVYLNNNGTLSTTGKELINETMLVMGYAKFNENHNYMKYYGTLQSAEQYSKNRKIGVWDSSSGKWIYSNNLININTASESQLCDYLDGLTYKIAQDIVEYRENNPFNTVEEIKYVTGFTKDLYDKNRYSMNVCTSLNYADENELKTLSGISSNDIDKIMNYRNNKRFTSVSQVYDSAKIQETIYLEIKPFISVNEKNSIDSSIPDIVININTASASQIREISDISNADATKIVDYRRNTLYGYKTLLEIAEIPGITLNETDIHYLADNFNLYTNINTASDRELRTLLGLDYTSNLVDKIKQQRPFSFISQLEEIIGYSKFDEIEPFIYTDEIPTPNRININTATKSQLTSLKLSDAAISNITANQREMFNAKEIEADTAKVRDKIALFTNINTATESELLSLHPSMSKMITSIRNYRNDQIFGSIDEIKKLFSNNDAFEIFSQIEEFIVVR